MGTIFPIRTRKGLKFSRPVGGIRLKILVPYVLLLLLAFVVAGMVIINGTRTYLLGQRIREETRITEKLATELAPMLKQSLAEELYSAAWQQRESQSRLLVLSPKGTVLVDTYSQFTGMRLNNSEVNRIVAGEPSAYGLHDLPSQSGGKEVTLTNMINGEITNTEKNGCFSAVMVLGGERIGILLRSVSIQDVDTQINRITSTILLTFVGAVVVVLLLGFFLSGFIVKPINLLASAMRKTSQGDFSVRANMRGRDEIARLANTFNMMSEKLENLDRTRNAFISSASHELKTPLASMKLLIENLLHMGVTDPDIQAEFLTDVNNEIDRLNAIVNDLLTLVQIDSGDMKPRREPVELGEALGDVVRRLRTIAKERHISLSLETGGREAVVLGDPIKLTQVFYNLIDNGIKYTSDSGSVSVRLTVDAARFQGVVEVTDTGVGIPEEDLVHIFDRFYRVDKARSRATGGTGLGLSIVRDIVKLHEGEISVTSELGQGSTFTVRLPIAEKEARG